MCIRDRQWVCENINLGLDELLQQTIEFPSIQIGFETAFKSLESDHTFELFKPGQEQNRDFYAELPIAVKITGNYHDIGAFASDIAKLPRIVTLNNVTLTPAPSGRMILDATTKTFRYLDEEEVDKQKQAAKQGAKK